MKEPSVYESYSYFFHFLTVEMDDLLQEIEERSHMGKYCLESEVLKELCGWSHKRENVKGLKRELLGVYCASPVVNARFFERQ